MVVGKNAVTSRQPQSVKQNRRRHLAKKMRRESTGQKLAVCDSIYESTEKVMYLDHPKITATNGNTEPDRLERLNRVYGYAVGLADGVGNKECLAKLSHLHDHKGKLIVAWFSSPTEEEKSFFSRAWQSKIGDETAIVEHELETAGRGRVVAT
jgi:hypothetical protein